MGELKTVISANIPVSLAQRLKGKTKGTRSRVVARALRAYLDDKEAFTIDDISSRRLMAALLSRKDVSDALKAVVLAELNA